jgi:lipopolysaccharide transport protein LptA
MIKLITIFFIVVISTFVNAQELKIYSDQLEVNRNEQLSTFTGNVHVIGDQFELWSKELLVKTDDTERTISEILALKDVKINRENVIAQGQNATYFPEKNTLHMRGNVEVTENNNTIYCEELFMDIDNSSTIMTGNSSDRVEAIIFSN